ncbi:MAG: MFS transporter [Steroidobacteraceae bacterium]
MPQAGGDAPMRSATGEQPADRRGQISWALFEFARSPYISLVYVFVFPPYFANVVMGDPVRGQEAWSLANTLVGVFVALLAPLLGAISDRTGPRKPWLVTVAVVMSLGCMALWYAMPGAQGGLPVAVILAIVVLLATGFQFTEVFHNAMLASIARADRIGGLSGFGISTGNLGTLMAMLVMLFGVALPASGITIGGLLPGEPFFGLDPSTHEHNRIAGPVAGVWFLIFIVPLMLWTPDRPSTGVSAGVAVREGLAQLWLTVKRVRKVSNVALYLLARMLYTDGKVAVLAYSGIYAAGEFGWELTDILLFALVLSPFSISGGFIGGWLDNRFGSKRAIQVSVGLSCLGMLGAVSMTPDQILFLPYDAAAAAPLWQFPYFQTLPEVLYIVVVMTLAITITAAFCTSRTMMARIAPVSMMSQFFGLYALSGTATAFLGHALVAAFTGAFESQRAGFASLIILLLAGFLLMFKVRQERAPEIA